MFRVAHRGLGSVAFLWGADHPIWPHLVAPDASGGVGGCAVADARDGTPGVAIAFGATHCTTIREPKTSLPVLAGELAFLGGGLGLALFFNCH